MVELEGEVESGVRQGCPRSPVWFVAVMEVLLCMIRKESVESVNDSRKWWKECKSIGLNG